MFTFQRMEEELSLQKCKWLREYFKKQTQEISNIIFFNHEERQFPQWPTWSGIHLQASFLTLWYKLSLKLELPPSCGLEWMVSIYKSSDLVYFYILHPYWISFWSVFERNLKKIVEDKNQSKNFFLQILWKSIDIKIKPALQIVTLKSISECAPLHVYLVKRLPFWFEFIFPNPSTFGRVHFLFFFALWALKIYGSHLFYTLPILVCRLTVVRAIKIQAKAIII